MAKITDENDNLVDVTCEITQRDMNCIFELAVKIYRIEVEYHSDGLIMANDAISMMRQYARQIAALARWEKL